MTLDGLIMLAGVLVALLPFLGFPTSWDSVILFVAGICIIALGIVTRRRGLGLSEEEQRQKIARELEQKSTQ